MRQRSADPHAVGNGDAVDAVELFAHGEQFGVIDLGCVELAGGQAQDAAVGVDTTVAFTTGGRDFAVGGCGGAPGSGAE